MSDLTHYLFSNAPVNSVCGLIMRDNAVFKRLKKDAAYAQRSALDGYGSSLLWQVSGQISMAYELGAIDTDQLRELNGMTIVFMNTDPDYIAVCNRQFVDDARACALPECEGCTRKQSAIAETDNIKEVES